MFYGLLLDVSTHALVATDEHAANARELDASWLLGLEAWVQLSVFSLLPTEARVPTVQAVKRC